MVHKQFVDVVSDNCVSVVHIEQLTAALVEVDHSVVPVERHHARVELVENCLPPDGYQIEESSPEYRQCDEDSRDHEHDWRQIEWNISELEGEVPNHGSQSGENERPHLHCEHVR